MVNSSAGFWYPYHWNAIADEVRVAGQTNDLGEFNASVFSGHAVSMLVSNQRYLEDFLNHLGGGLRFATIVVAASDSKDTVKAHSDFVCTGSHDEATVQAAINALPATGGKVLLMEGHYYFSAVLGGANNGQIGLVPNCTLEGMGPGTIITYINNLTVGNATWLVGASGSGGLGISFMRVTNIAFNINYTNNNAVGASIGAIVFSSTIGAIVDHCWILDGSPSQLAVLIEDGITGTLMATQFTNNYVQNGLILLSTDASDISNTLITDNVINGGYIALENVIGAVVTDNQIAGQGTGNFGQTSHGIYVYNVARSVIAHNRISRMQDGIFSDSTSSSCVVNENHIFACQQTGITISSGTDMDVKGNHVDSCSQATANTYDAILVSAGGTQCDVQDNTVRGTSHRYGINNAGTGTLVVNNDLHGGYTTAATNNSGTWEVNLDGSANNWNRT